MTSKAELCQSDCPLAVQTVHRLEMGWGKMQPGPLTLVTVPRQQANHGFQLHSYFRIPSNRSADITQHWYQHVGYVINVGCVLQEIVLAEVLCSESFMVRPNPTSCLHQHSAVCSTRNGSGAWPLAA